MAHPNTIPKSIDADAAGVTGGYDGNLPTKLVIAFCDGLAIYNAIELWVLIFLTFTRYRGVYFYSLLIASFGIVPCALGFFLKFFSIGSVWLALSLIQGWIPMVTGQSMVLWSRLHLLVRGERGETILRWTKWMIIVNAVVLHIPTTVLSFGANANIPVFVRGYGVMEKIQMSGFFVQESLLSSIYIWEAIHLLRTSLHPNARNLMYQLFAINFLIILLDLGMLGLECASLYTLQVTVKPVIYSIKLKLEFAVLSRLVRSVRVGTANSPSGSRRSSSKGFVVEIRHGSRRDEDISDFVDLDRISSDVTRATRKLNMTHVSVSDSDLVISQVPTLTDATFRDVNLDGNP